MGEGLKEKREAMGLSLEDVQRDTRIPIEHLRAIEEGRFDDLPVGPFRSGWIRGYRERLGLDPSTLGKTPAPAPASAPSATPKPATATPGAARQVDRHPEDEVPRKKADKPPVVPLWGVRVLAGAGVAALVAVLAYEIWLQTRPEAVSPVVVPQVEIVAQREVAIQVSVDDAIAETHRLAPGVTLSFSGRKVVVDVPAVEAVKISYDGRPVVPQGQQDEPRRLVFEDDASGSP